MISKMGAGHFTAVRCMLLSLLLLLCGTSLRAQLQANFTANKMGGCSPLDIRFTNTTTGASAAAQYSWDLGNGNTSILQHAAAIYAEEKAYTVTLTVTDGSQTSSKSVAVTVYKKPVVDLTPNVVKGCLPLAVTFTANAQPGDGNMASYHWDFGDGSTSQVTSVTALHTYELEQLATISLTAYNNYGCHSTVVKQNLVNIIPHLSADFTSSQQVLCHVNDAVQFTNKSKGPGTLSYAWDFGDGQTSTAANPAPAFNKKGTYTVKLTTTSSEGCVATKTSTNLLNVANYSTDITMPALICRDSYGYFTSVNYPSPNSQTWTLDGNYFGNNNQAYYSALAAGNHTLSLTATYGACPQTVSKTFKVEELPLATDFVADLKDVCGAPAKVEFKDVSTDGVKWEWDFDYNSWQPQMDAFVKEPSHTYPGNNYYNVLLRVYNAAGCSKQLTKQVYIAKPSVTVRRAGINPWGDVISCGPVNITFEGATTETLTKYKWIFDNGAGTSTLVQPTYTFSTPGYHNVTLEYETDKGCKGSAAYEYQISVRTRPKADFTTVNGPNICGNTFALFKSLSTGQVNSEYWFINDAFSGYSSGGQFAKQFTEKGKYSIMLIADNTGCRDTMIKTDYINVLAPFPVITTITNSCQERGKVTFGQASRYGEKWIWDFGDGQTQTLTTDEPATSHVYAQTGTYKIVLTVTNGQCSVRDSNTAYVLLKPTPVLTSSLTEICAETPLPFTVSNLPPTPYTWLGAHYYTYAWEYADGTPFTGDDGSWSKLIDPLPYSNRLLGLDRTKDKIRLIVQERGFGCLDTSNFIPYKLKGSDPSFQFVKNNVCFDAPVELKNISVITPGNAITKWVWSFGDGAIVTKTTGDNVTHQYTSPGEYPVSLTITDNTGCQVTSVSTSNTAYARVHGPKAGFNASASVIPVESSVNFYNTTNDFGHYRAVYDWDFGDGQTGTGSYTNHKYTTVGKYTVKLKATDPVNGCTSTATTTITVEPVKAAFETTRTFIGQSNCLPLLASFSAIYINAVNMQWDFGDGITAGDVRSPKHIYEKPGRYIIRLRATGTNGLPLLYTDSIIIPEAKVQLTAATWKGCPGDDIQWQVNGSNTNDLVWDYGDGSTGTSQNGPHAHRYAEPGTYGPNLLMKDASGCVTASAVSHKVTIHPRPVIQISPATAMLCEGNSLQLTATGGNVYKWSPATAISNVNIANPVISPVQSLTYQLQVTDANGCRNEKAYPVTVHPPVTLSLDGDAVLCIGESKAFKASGAHHYAWIDHTAGLNNLQSPSAIATPSATGVYTLVGYDEFGCFTDTATASVTVNPRPVPDAGKDVEIEAGKKVTLTATTAGNEPVTWKWSPATYLSCSNCASPVCIPLADTRYTATATNQYGCDAADEVLVKLVCNESKVRIPNGFSPNGDGNNDQFVIKGISFVKHLSIYNRWGSKVFERHNFVAANTGWDGSLGGQAQPTGTYVYFIEMQCDTGGSFTRKGTLLLVR